MKNILPRKLRDDPARSRYPEALAGLFTLGQAKEDHDYGPQAQLLADYVPDLIRMVLDDDLNERTEKDPAVWVPYHALKVLGELGPAEAAEPLLAGFALDDDWMGEALPPVYASIGPVAIPVLHAYLEDRSHDLHARGDASNALVAIAQAHPATRAEVVALLTAFLDRPGADAGGDEESITAFVIADLGDLKATTSYEAIRRAFTEDRVDAQVIGLDDIERDFGMRPAPDFSQPPQPRKEPGVRLVLKCKACGREREHIFARVYYDMGTATDDKKRAKYDPLVIPERVTCPKCGAVDQYELGGMGHMAILASLMAERTPELAANLRPDQRVRPINFTTRWGPMHPQEAIERYQRELAGQPDSADLHVGLGNVYRALGRYSQADVEFERALALDPRNPDVWVNLAQMAGMRRDRDEAIRCWERVRELARRSDLAPDEAALLADAADESLADLRRGVFVDFDPFAPPAEPAGPRTPGQRKVGRNEPCPCGSGKKYKHCHGRKG
jgi:tetratricopeptide (TPR) repeat protein